MIKNANLVITLDGPAGSGKSTLAKILAEELGLYQIDSGALYRAYTFLALELLKGDSGKLLSSMQKSEFINQLKSHEVEISFKDFRQQVWVDKTRLSQELRTPEVTQNIKSIADNRPLREHINAKLRTLSETYPIVADGRDMGTVVFPEADIKFFVTASVQERALRRYEEMKEKFPDIELLELEEQIASRDRQDQEREFGQLKQADDAIFIDTTGHSLKAVLVNLKGILKNTLPEHLLRKINLKI